MPFKTFSDGEVLFAADVNDFLMKQAVAVFADSAARGSAITAPVEGQVTYLQDSGEYEYWDSVGSWEPLVSVTTLPGSAITGVITDATIPAENVTPALQTLATATYTVAPTDAQNTLVFTASAATATFSTATAFSAGDRVDIVRDGATSLRITGGAGVFFAGKGTAGTAISYDIDEQFEAASVLCVATNEYRVIGAVSKV